MGMPPFFIVWFLTKGMQDIPCFFLFFNMLSKRNNLSRSQKLSKEYFIFFNMTSCFLLRPFGLWRGNNVNHIYCCHLQMKLDLSSSRICAMEIFDHDKVYCKISLRRQKWCHRRNQNDVLMLLDKFLVNQEEVEYDVRVWCRNLVMKNLTQRYVTELIFLER